MTDARDLSPRDAVNRWLDRRRPDLRESSVSALWYRLKLFVEFCERESIESMSQVDAWLLDEYQLARHRSAKPLTLKAEFGTLRQFIEYCEQLGLSEDDLSDAIELPDLSPDERTDDTLLPPERGERLLEWYRSSPERAHRQHAILEVLWTVGCRSGALRSLDLRDFDPDEQWLRFVHREETDTELKKGVASERFVGLLDETTDVLEEFVAEHRLDVTDSKGRSPLFPSEQGRPNTGTIRDWTYLATTPCKHDPCPHDREPSSCDWLSYSTASNCPSTRSPHQVRSGSITWQLSRGIPVDVVAERVDSSPETIEQHYDKEDPRRELEKRRRGYLDNLSLDNDTDS